jgi:two-component sensor histidine kinase
MYFLLRKCLFFLLFLPATFSAQIPDSIRLELESLPTESRSEWLRTEAEKFRQKDPSIAYVMIREAFNYMPIDEAELNLTMGKIQTDLAEYDSAKHYLQLAEIFFDSTANELNLLQTYLAQENVYSKTRELKVALELALKAATNAEQLGEKVLQATAYERVADIHFMQREFEESLDYCDKAEALLEEDEALELRGKIHLTRGYVFLLQSYYELALEQMTLAIEQFTAAGSSQITLSGAVNGRGNVYKHMEQFEAAINDYQENLRICTAANYKRGIMVSNANIGHTLLLNEQYQEALNYLHSAREAMEATNDRANLWEQYMHLTTAYETLGEYKDALHYHQLYYAENEDYYENKIDQLEAEIQTKYETGQRAAKIVLQEEKISTQQRNLLLTLAGIIVLAIILGLLYYNYSNSKRLGKELARKNEEKELLLKEIHHRVKNNLQTISSLLNLQSAHIEDEQVLGAVVESKNRVRSMALIHQKLYQGDNLVSIEMKEYLETLCGNLIKSFGKNADKVSLNCSMDAIELDVDTAIPIGLIINELITNTMKYAFPDGRAGQIEVSLTHLQEEDVLLLSVKDDGVGMSEQLQPDERRTNFGSHLVNLLTMQLGGAVEQDTTEGYHTRIKFKKFKLYPTVTS